MTVELKIVYDGDEPGLSEHRLSLASFGEPLRLLLAALQRTASGMIADALDDPAYGSRGGKLASDAKLLDLELATIEGGCVAPTFICKARPGRQLTIDSVETLSERAIKRLLEDIDAERQGQAVSASARRYLGSIPRGVRRQRYTAAADGNVLFDVEFGEATIASIPTPPARLLRLAGRIVGAGFEHGSSYVALKADGRTVRCAASVEQVEKALPLRHQDVLAAVLDGQKATLIWLRDAAAEVAPVPLKRTTEHLRSEWSETLRILAQ